MTCGAIHPERPELVCQIEASHADHSAWTREGFVEWPNESYVPPPERNTKKQASAARDKFLNAAEQVAPETHVLPDPGENTVGATHRDPHDTEVAAAFAIWPRSGSLREQVLMLFIDLYPAGATDEEVFRHLYGDSRREQSSSRKRRTELVDGGWLQDSGQYRDTMAGNPSIVWVLTEEGRQRAIAEGRMAFDPVGSFALRDFG